MHTPQEARTLWCPMVGGRPEGTSEKCMADRCAMWRWEHTTASVPVEHKSIDGVREYTTYEQRTVRTHGYCGLAPLHSTTN